MEERKGKDSLRLFISMGRLPFHIQFRRRAGNPNNEEASALKVEEEELPTTAMTLDGAAVRLGYSSSTPAWSVYSLQKKPPIETS